MCIIRTCTVTKMDMAAYLCYSCLKRVLGQGCNFQRDSWQLDTGISEWSYYNFFFVMHLMGEAYVVWKYYKIQLSNLSNINASDIKIISNW